MPGPSRNRAGRAGAGAGRAAALRAPAASNAAAPRRPPAPREGARRRLHPPPLAPHSPSFFLPPSRLPVSSVVGTAASRTRSRGSCTISGLEDSRFSRVPGRVRAPATPRKGDPGSHVPTQGCLRARREGARAGDEEMRGPSQQSPPAAAPPKEDSRKASGCACSAWHCAAGHCRADFNKGTCWSSL